jgi:hypothetical protein
LAHPSNKTLLAETNSSSLDTAAIFFRPPGLAHTSDQEH